MKIAIIGGGLVGMATALELRRSLPAATACLAIGEEIATTVRSLIPSNHSL